MSSASITHVGAGDNAQNSIDADAGQPEKRWPATRIIASLTALLHHSFMQLKLAASFGSPVGYAHGGRVRPPVPFAIGMAGGATAFLTQLSRMFGMSQVGEKLPPRWASPGAI
jgi:hypothetical protein